MKDQSLENSVTTASHESVRTYSNLFPVDLLMDILSLLPAKSIARFRCVSKFWASFLRRPDFTELFLTKSPSRPRLFFTLEVNNEKLFFYSSPQPQNLDEQDPWILDEEDCWSLCEEDSWNSDDEYSWSSDEDDTCLVATRYHASYPEYVPTEKCTMVCGLALLETYTKTRKLRVICNPATGEFITLPKVLLKPKDLPKEEARSYPDKIEGFYFGYDPIEKQYKVLCMTTSRSKRPNTHMVLILENGKRSWRSIDHKFHFVGSDRTRSQVCINGVLFFGADDINRSTVIVSFDVRSENFGFINTVGYMSLSGDYVLGFLTLFNYKGKLGLHEREKSFFYRNEKDEIVFWVLDDAGNHRWSKHTYETSSLVKQIVERKMFVGMTSAGDMVWSPFPGSVSDHFYLFFYNLESKTFAKVNVKGFKELKEYNYKRHYIRLHTFGDYAENIIKNDTWSQLKLTHVSCRNRALAKEEKRVSTTEIQVSVPTSNKFDILGSFDLE